MTIKSKLTNVTLIEDEAWNDFEQFFAEKTIRKNEVLWKAGDTCRHLIYISKGLIRVYNTKDDKEVTHSFILKKVFSMMITVLYPNNPVAVIMKP